MRIFLIDAKRETVVTQVYGGTALHLKKILGTEKLDIVELANGNCFVASDEDDEDGYEDEPHFFFADWGLPHYQSAAIVGPPLAGGEKFGEVEMSKAELERLIRWGA